MLHRPHKFQGNVTRPRACNVCALPPEDPGHVDVTPPFDMDGVLAREQETVFAGSDFPALDDVSAARLKGDTKRDQTDNRTELGRSATRMLQPPEEEWRSKTERHNYDGPRRKVRDNPQA